MGFTLEESALVQNAAAAVANIDFDIPRLVAMQAEWNEKAAVKPQLSDYAALFELAPFEYRPMAT